MADRIDKIIEDALVDTYDEYEELSGWLCTLEENIAIPQECQIGRKPATLLKIVEAKGGLAIHGVVVFGTGRKRISAPIEHIELKNKRQNIFIMAYRKWLAGV